MSDKLDTNFYSGFTFTSENGESVLVTANDGHEGLHSHDLGDNEKRGKHREPTKDEETLYKAQVEYIEEEEKKVREAEEKAKSEEQKNS